MTITDLRSIPKEEYPQHGLSGERLLGMLRNMIEIRRFEEKAEELYLLKGQITGPLHLYLGQEAVAAGVMSLLEKEDIVLTTYRGHGHAIAKGVPMKPLMAELFGKSTGTCKGLSGSMHAAIDRERGVLFASAIVAGGIPIAAGAALAMKHRGTKNVATVFLGDGAVNIGSFHEGLNLAAVWRLPVLFVCENNLYAMSTNIDKAMSSESIAVRASSYGMKTFIADGNDAVSVYVATRKALEGIRSDEGPAFLECRTYKMKGHGVYDKAEYRPREEAAPWLKRDPIELLKAKVLKDGLIDEAGIKRVEAEVEEAVEESVDFAVRSPVLAFEELETLVYS